MNRLTEQTATKHIFKIKSISGTLALTSSEKYPFTAYSPPGLTICVAMGAKTKAPKPNPPIMIPDTKPGQFGNQSQP